MSDDLAEHLDGKALLIEAVVDRYGERCSDYQAGCACCAAWRNIDRIEELEAKLAKAVGTLWAVVLDSTCSLDRRTYTKCNAALAEINGGGDE